MINFCGKCGQKLNPGDKACSNCGWTVPVSDSSSPDPTPKSSAEPISSAAQPSPDQLKLANTYFWLVLGLYLVPSLLNDIFLFFEYVNIIDLAVVSTVLSWLTPLTSLSALILVIYAHLKYKFSTRLHVLFWIIIVLTILQALFIVYLMLVCGVMLSSVTSCY